MCVLNCVCSYIYEIKINMYGKKNYTFLLEVKNYRKKFDLKYSRTTYVCSVNIVQHILDCKDKYITHTESVLM